ncbi:MAG: TonB-dependent receptor, partial [Sulfurimonadaceae bacterium]|nr:TonB-dependent receptor [Sulfurimonadaceae bacterium]
MMTRLSVVAVSLLCTTAINAADKPVGPIQENYLEMMPIDKFVDVLSIEELLDVVVTDTKIAQPKNTVTQRIVSMHDAQFEQLTSYNRNIAELMKYSAGQFVNVLSRNDANWGSYGGLGPKYNTYMIDGLPIDSFADGMSLDPWAFERVESQRGPASVLYSNYMTMDFAGNEAPLAGTTNFILKERIDTPMTRAQVGAGSYNTYNGRAFHQNRSGDLSYFFGASLEQSDYTQYGPEGSWLQTVEDPDYKKAKVYGKASWKVDDDHSLSLFVHHADHTGDLGRPNRGFEHAYNTVNLKYTNQLTDTLNLQVKAGYRDYDRVFESDHYDTNLTWRKTSYTRQEIIPVDVTLSYSHGSGGLLTVGADAQWAAYETDTLNSGGLTPNNDVKADSAALFIQEKYLLDKWVIRGGLRYDRVNHEYNLLSSVVPLQASASWNKLLWSAGVRYNMSETLSWYANTGSSFMAPSAKQSGGTVSNPGDSGQLPNPNLDPEEGVATDIGFDYTPVKGFVIGVRAFYNVVEDAIVDNVVSVVPSQTQSINAGETVAAGVELDVHNRSSQELEWFANVTYTATEVKNSADADNDGTDITFVPDYVVNAGLTARLPWEITVSPYYQWVGTYYDSTSKSG